MENRKTARIHVSFDSTQVIVIHFGLPNNQLLTIEYRHVSHTSDKSMRLTELQVAYWQEYLSLKQLTKQKKKEEKVC